MSDKPTVVEALAAVMGEVQAVGKKDRNSQQGYDFRGIDAVVNAVGPAFRKHGIVPTPHKSEARYRDVQTSTGKPSRECTVTVTYRFYGPAGDFIDCEVPGESMDFGDKGAPKAMSVAYRIALLQTLCIPTHEPEPDAQAYERGEYSYWDAAEQDVLVTGWTAEIEDAKDETALKEIGRKLLAAKRRKELSPASYDHLAVAGAARKAEMNGGQPAPERQSVSRPTNPGSMTQKTQGRMFSLFTALKLDGDENAAARRGFAGGVLGHEVPSVGALSESDALLVVAGLEKRKREMAVTK